MLARLLTALAAGVAARDALRRRSGAAVPAVALIAVSYFVLLGGVRQRDARRALAGPRAAPPSRSSRCATLGVLRRAASCAASSGAPDRQWTGSPILPASLRRRATRSEAASRRSIDRSRRAEGDAAGPVLLRDQVVEVVRGGELARAFAASAPRSPRAPRTRSRVRIATSRSYMPIALSLISSTNTSRCRRRAGSMP